jgi:Ca-activated chloride channel homolog
MSIDAKDPRWTAYALGEIKDGPEKDELESILSRSSEMREMVDEIRSVAALLSEELRAESAPNLLPSQRNRIETRLDSRSHWFQSKMAWALATAAATVVLTASVMIYRVHRQQASLPQNQSTETATVGGVASPQNPAALNPTAPPDTNKPGATEAQPILTADKKPKENDKPETEITSPASIASVTSKLVLSAEQHALLKGTVRDSSGAVIPGAIVSAINNATGKTTEVATNQAGQYTFSSLLPGKYSVTISSPGFSQEKLPALSVGASASKTVDSTLQIGSLAETVQAFAEAPAIQTAAVSSQGGISAIGMHSPSPPPPGMLIPPERAKAPNEKLFPMPHQQGQFNTEAYDSIRDNPFQDVSQNPLSTFSIDVDTASYSNMRRYLNNGSLPPKDAIRIEELINYFDYSYPVPTDGKPFSASLEMVQAPWKPEHRLLRIGIKGREFNSEKRPAGNLVFLLDVSGSMADANKLPLVKDSMRLLVDRLTENDRIAIVVYSSNSGLWLPSTSGDQKEKLRQAIDGLAAGGSTNGASGIELAYQTAQTNFIKGGVNRVILATDGDFNVGITNRGDLTRLIEEKAKGGIYLSVLGFGMGNYKDATLETLADKGRGNHAYIDSIDEAKKVLVEQINSTLVTIAKDVKIQVEFNPKRVSAYRLIGYEDRIMSKEDFNDDIKSAGAIGAGHTVTALYELIPAGQPVPASGVDPLKYQIPPKLSQASSNDEMLTLKLRYKEPDKDVSSLLAFVVKDAGKKFSEASGDFKFAAAVAAFGMFLRDSPYKGSATLDNALEWAKEGQGSDSRGYRQEFIRLIHRAISFPQK